MKAHDNIPAGFPMRALVTRPRAEAETLAAMLARRGIETIIEPLIDIAATGAALPDLSGVRAMLCTSANGARALARASGERGIAVFTVGDATGRAARDAGFARVESAGGDVDDLARLVRRRLRPADGRLLHVAGSAVAGDLAALLAADGFAVERAVLYEARAATALKAPTARLIAAGAIDLALFFSPRTAAIFARLVEDAGVAAGLAATVAIAISPSVAAPLAALPFRDRLVADAPTQAALIASIVPLFGLPA
jgi:uroporphyrinogen-III synthase